MRRIDMELYQNLKYRIRKNDLLLAQCPVRISAKYEFSDFLNPGERLASTIVTPRFYLFTIQKNTNIVGAIIKGLEK